MMPSKENPSQFFLLVYLDVKGLFERIVDRKFHYVKALTMKRNREPLKEVFKCKYFDIGVESLSCYPEKVIKMLDEYYRLTDDLYWYLDNTEDMTQAIKDKVDAYLIHLKRIYSNLILELEKFSPVESDSENQEQVPELTTIDKSEIDFDVGSELEVDTELNLETEQNFEPGEELSFESEEEESSFDKKTELELAPPILPSIPES
jgi:hypothetical protein